MGVAHRYAHHLLDSFDVSPLRPFDLADEHPAHSWARSGLMALTGSSEDEPQMCPVPLAACADGALAALAALAPAGVFNDLRGSRLLAERAAIAGHARAGSTSPGGSCRLLETTDGGIALNLARDDDWALLPAWLECEVTPDWDSVTQAVQHKRVQELVQRGRLLGLAVTADELPAEKSMWHRVVAGFDSRPAREPSEKPVVVDLSSLWAGPLCSHLLQRLGAEVIKVESLQRPDGARQGPLEFFELLNTGKRNATLDFSSTQGRAQLRALIERADIVIEGSRPRALRQLGIHAEELLAQNPGLSWISISGYGRGEAENWIAYGDDAAVAAGLSSIQYQATGQRMIVGDAIADPLTGLHAALVGWSSWLSGGGRLISLALCDVVNRCIHFDLPGSAEAIRARQQEWTALAQNEVAQPCARK